MRTVFLAMKKGRQMPPLVFELFCMSETPQYGNVKCSHNCRLRSRRFIYTVIVKALI